MAAGYSRILRIVMIAALALGVAQGSSQQAHAQQTNPRSAFTTVGLSEMSTVTALSADLTTVFIAGQGWLWSADSGTGSIKAQHEITGTATAIAVAGSLVAVASGSTISTFDATSLRSAATQTLPNEVTAISSSSDGGRIFATVRDEDRLAILMSTDLSISGYAATGDAPSSVTMSPDGARLYVTNRDDATVSILDGSSYASLGSLGTGLLPQDGAVSPDGLTLFVTSATGTDSFSTASQARTAHSPATGSDIAVSPNGSRLYLAGYSTVRGGFLGSVTVFDPPTLTSLGRFETSTALASISPGSTTAWLATPYTKSALRLDLTAKLPGAPSNVKVAAGPGGDAEVTWKPAPEQVKTTYHASGDGYGCTSTTDSCTADHGIPPGDPGEFGVYAQTTTGSSPVAQGSLTGRTAITDVFDIPYSAGRGMASSPDGSIIYATAQTTVNDGPGTVSTGWVAAVNASTGVVARWTKAGVVPGDIVVTPDGSRLVVAAFSKVLVLDTSTGTTLQSLPTTNVIQRMGISPVSGRTFVPSQGQIAVVDPASTAIVATIPTSEDASAVAVAQDGARAYALGTSHVYVIDTATNAITDTWNYGGNYPSCGCSLAVSPDGSRLFVAQQGSVEELDTRTGKSLGKQGVGGLATDIVATADGRRILVGTRDGDVLTLSTKDLSVIGSVVGRDTITTLTMAADARAYSLSDSGQVSSFDLRIAQPSAPRQVKVRTVGRKHIVTWQQPKADGSARILWYRVTNNRGYCEAKARSCTLKGGSASSVTVEAVSQAGVGTPASPR